VPVAVGGRPVSTYAWVGDRLVALEAAGVPVDDRGFTNGDGCFETLKVVDGVPFALTRHLARLRRSLAVLGISAPEDDRLRAACAAVVSANDPGVGRLRITVTAGRAPLGPGRDGSEPGLVILTGPPRRLAPTSVVAVGPWIRNERSPLAGVKATSYAENAVAYRWGEERGADEVLFANTREELCEGTGSNIFLVVDGALRTPPLSSGCLAGVTRELVCELVDVDESPIPMAMLADASEAFLTSSTRDVHPVSVLDGRSLDPAPGPVTAAVQAAWAGLPVDP
jgi:branched-chain amino acid aminotransferase